MPGMEHILDVDGCARLPKKIYLWAGSFFAFPDFCKCWNTVHFDAKFELYTIFFSIFLKHEWVWKTRVSIYGICCQFEIWIYNQAILKPLSSTVLIASTMRVLLWLLRCLRCTRMTTSSPSVLPCRKTDTHTLRGLGIGRTIFGAIRTDGRTDGRTDRQTKKPVRTSLYIIWISSCPHSKSRKCK